MPSGLILEGGHGGQVYKIEACLQVPCISSPDKGTKVSPLIIASVGPSAEAPSDIEGEGLSNRERVCGGEGTRRIGCTRGELVDGYFVPLKVAVFHLAIAGTDLAASLKMVLARATSVHLVLDRTTIRCAIIVVLSSFSRVFDDEGGASYLSWSGAPPLAVFVGIGRLYWCWKV